MTSPAGRFSYVYTINSGNSDLIRQLNLTGDESIYVLNDYDDYGRLNNTALHTPLQSPADWFG